MRRLIIRPGAIGDCILCLPAMEFLRAEYTEVWVASANSPLIRFADRVRGIASTGLDLVGIPGCEPPTALIESLAGFDSIVSWYGTSRREFHDAVAAFPFVFHAALPSEVNMHAADFYLHQVGGGEAPAAPRIPCPRVAGDFVAVHPFSGGARKNWPLEHFRELASHLKFPVRWCVGPEETLAGAVCIDDLYDLGCWLGGARAYIGNDSGITHLAAAVGVPVIALFGPSDPAVWAPRGECVRVISTPRVGDPMETIPLAAVLEASVSLGVA